jgi:uncharacterized protein (TIGR00251 family)
MAESVRLQLRVSPGASRAGIVGRYGDAWKVRVEARPEGGRANEAVARLLAKVLDLPRRDVEIVSGHANRDKIVSVAGIAPDEAERRLASASDAAGKGRT